MSPLGAPLYPLQRTRTCAVSRAGASKVITNPQQEWDDARKSALVAQIVNAQLSIKDACERYGLNAAKVQEWLRLFRRSALLAFDEQLKQALINQGADADDLSAAEFTGTLDDISLCDLVQTIQMAGKDAVITITTEEGVSRIWCLRGAIIDAESGPLVAEAAVYRMLGFEHGRLVADLRSAPRVRSIHASTHGLLLEAARRKDESARLRRVLGDEQCIYRLGLRATAPRTCLTAQQLALLRLFDGERSLREVLAQSELGDLETLTTLQQLMDGEYLIQSGFAAIVSRPPSESAGARNSVATMWPQVSTRRPEQATRSWLWGVLAASLSVPVASWAWVQASGASARPAAAPIVVESPREAPALPPSYVVEVRAEPTDAEIWLDGHKVATGRFRTLLARDRSAHELQVISEGHVPRELFFVDSPPPSEVRLQRLPQPAAAPAPEAAAPRRARHGSTPSAKAAALRRAENEARDALAGVRRRGEPRVDIIEGDAPTVQVIE
jgi:transposase-like protein